MHVKGLHAAPDVLSAYLNIDGNRLFEVETGGMILHNDKCEFAAQKMKLVREIDTEKLSRAFAIDCARRCLHNYEAVYPSDDRPRKAIEAAETYLNAPSDENKLLANTAVESASAAWSSSAYWSSHYVAISMSSAAFAAESAMHAAKTTSDSVNVSAWSAAKCAAASLATFATGSAKSGMSGYDFKFAIFSMVAAEHAVESVEENRQRGVLETLINSGKYYL